MLFFCCKQIARHCQHRKLTMWYFYEKVTGLWYLSFVVICSDDGHNCRGLWCAILAKIERSHKPIVDYVSRCLHSYIVWANVQVGKRKSVQLIQIVSCSGFLRFCLQLLYKPNLCTHSDKTCKEIILCLFQLCL